MAQQLKIKPIAIDPAKPFANDKLDREPEIRNLTELVKNTNTPMVLAVNSGWGTGKTTFIQMWKAYLDQQKIPALYFNAWTTDFSPDPLVSFLGEMNEGLKSFIEASKAEKAWKKALDKGIQATKKGGPILAKALATKVLGSEAVGEITGNLTEDILNAYLEQKGAITQFREAMTEFLEGAGQGPLVIFVDELDRCRPDYAISLLERIKHLFDIEGIVFVLALDKKQLGHSIRAVYGTDFDAAGYLRRFIDFEYATKLPDIEHIEHYVETIVDSSFPVLKTKLDEPLATLTKLFSMLSTYFHFSLREIEQVLATIHLAMCTPPVGRNHATHLLVFLIIAKYQNSDIYQRYITQSSPEKMIDYLYSLTKELIREEPTVVAIIEASLIEGKYAWKANESAEYKRHENILNQKESSDSQKSYSQKVIEWTGKLQDNRGCHRHLAEASSAIEWASQFHFSAE